MFLGMRDQLDYILFFYGLSFLMLAYTSFVISLKSQSTFPWRFLILFGLTHGLNEWLDLTALSLADPKWFTVSRTCLMAASFVFLVEFGRATLEHKCRFLKRAWIYPPLLFLGMAGLKLGLPAWMGSLRLVLGLAGGLLSGAAFIFRSVETRIGMRQLGIAGFFMVFYAVAAGTVLPKSELPMPAFLTFDGFWAVAGFPIQLVRGICAAGISLAIWRYSELLNPFGWIGSVFDRFRGWLVAGILIFILVGGWLVTENFSRSLEDGMKANLLHEARIAASSISPETVVKLRPDVSDEKSSAHLAIKHELNDIRSAVSGSYRFVYLLTLDAGKVRFLLDSEPVDSKDYSRPGDDYTEAPPAVRSLSPLSPGITVGPYEDRWGRWISAFVPIVHDNGRIVAVLGMDRNAGDWRHYILAQRLLPITITLLLALLTLGVLAFERKSREAKNRLQHLDKIVSLGTLAAGVAHEINNPLAILLGNAELLEEEFANYPPDHNVRTIVSKMTNSIGRISRIVTSLGIYVRAGSRENWGEIDVHESIKLTLLMVEDMFKKEGIVFDLRLEAQNPVIEHQKGGLDQVVMNLLTNARDATQGRTPRTILISTRDDNVGISIAVADNGCGISAGNLPHLFTQFFTTKAPGKGTGLGLSTCATIVGEMGGTISVSSKLDDGSVFTVWLPKKQQQS
jgi:signal transduction histidine kinase